MNDPLVGRVLLGRYRVVQRLAKGGMGLVYLARTEGSAGFVKPVVVKRILDELDERELVGMFVREARILSNLRHPNIAGIIDFAEEDGAHLMVLEYVHGYHLGQWRRYARRVRGHFDVDVAIQVVVTVLDALAYAHRLERPDGEVVEVIHRDVSPANVLVDLEGQVKLLDFGVARMSGGDTGLYKTETLMVKGKLPYVPPEQIKGAPPSVQGDVYACAVLLHELLVGENELRGADMAETVGRVLEHVPSALRATRSDVSEELDAVLARGLAKDPRARFTSAGELAEALRAARTLGADEARVRLLAQVREDYAAMPKVIGIDTLEARERAWRTPTEELSRAEGDTDPEVSKTSSDARLVETQLEVPEASPAPRSSRSWLPFALGGALTVALATAAGVAAFRFGDAAPPEPLFVVQQPSGPVRVAPEPAIEPPPEEDAPDPADAMEDESGAQPPNRAERPLRTRRPVAAGESLGATFARHGGEVESCLRAHAAQIQGAPELAVRFELARDGQVRRARVLPAALERTPLGACLRGVAERVRFAPQERDDVSFRIPITVERR